MSINFDSLIVRSEGQEFSKIENEVVLFDKETGNYFAINEVGSRIWEIIGTPIAVYEIIRILVNEYEIDEETCTKQTLQLLEALIINKLANLQKFE